MTGITGLPFTGLTRPIGGVCEVCRSLPLFVVHSRLSCRGVVFVSQVGLTSVIAHFKIAGMHVAVEKTVEVLPKTG